jgi:hypothetical protein
MGTDFGGTIKAKGAPKACAPAQKRPLRRALSPEGQTLENSLSPFFSASRFVDGDELRSVSKGGFDL